MEAATLTCPLNLHRCFFDQPINLREAQAPAVRLPGCRAPGLDGEQLRIQGNLELNKGFTAEGEVRLLGAHIGGQLDFEGAALTNPKGTALSAERLSVDQSMFCREGFTAQGEVNLLGAHVGGTLAFNGAALTNPEGPRSAPMASGSARDQRKRWSVLLQAPSGLDHPIRDEVYRVRSLGAFIPA